MKLLSYNITNIDEDNKNITVDFVFDDKSLNGKQTIHIGDVKKEEIVIQTIEQDVAIPIVDENGQQVVDENGELQFTIQKQEKQQSASLVTIQPRADLTSVDSLEACVKEYAEAFIRGKQAEQVQVSPEVNELINTVQEV